jgi:hypothetical protein
MTLRTGAGSFGCGGKQIRGKVLMPHEPAAHLPCHNRLTRHGHFAGPPACRAVATPEAGAVDPDAELPLFRERQIDQFHFEAGSAHMILNYHAIMRFGTGHDTFYRFNPLAASIILFPPVHAKVSSRAYRPRSNTR